jgi:xylitol oxidase
MLSLQNWAANLSYQATAYHFPDSVEEVRRLVERADRIKALGTRHSFSQIADTTGEMIALEKLNRIVALDRVAKTVTIEAGVRYGELCSYLAPEGFGLPNLASLPHISVAGACATATHGSGDRNLCLSASVRSMEFVTASGEVVTISRGDAEFAAAAVHLGALGVVVRLTLDLLPTFDVWQYVYEDLPLATLFEQFDAVTSAAYSGSLFTDWSSEAIKQVWLKSVQPVERDELFGAPRAQLKLHPIKEMSPKN